MFGYLISRNYWFTVFLTFMLGALSSIRREIGYVYTIELAPPQYKEVFSSVFLINGGLLSMTGVIYFKWISSYWIWLGLFGAILNVLGVLTVVPLPESPVWLVKKGDFVRAQASLEVIANKNGTRLEFNSD